jgi:hypothetical protein
MSAAPALIPARRGQPLIVLGLLLGGWISLRAVLWERIELPGLPVAVEAAARALAAPAASVLIPDQTTRSARALAAPALAPRSLAPAQLKLDHDRKPVEVFGLQGFQTGASATERMRIAAGHQLAWMAGVAQLPVPAFIVARLDNAQQTGLAVAAASRWSGSGWLMLREGGARLTGAGLPSPSYGASQIGAVLRYRLAPAHPRRPLLYLRGTSAVQVPRGEELAFGFSARPVARVPITLQAELRATQQARGITFRPAISAVTELPRFALPAGLTGEAYGQAGYVSGPDATAFADGQIRIERSLAGNDRVELRAGLGAWGGVQQGAARLDFGPTVTLDFPLARSPVRVSADWRSRAAGNAAPRSGPAVTLSAGF